ncbi:hypothetical protein [Devosia sp.]|uniref:hypothetical protein n=1 Tax=Devosia sp. TaxID=1871048 RepID=UPI0025CE7A89|nr:hypothetical protein [Devosia sp.]MCR6636151.1 hypothetical protein [Devosia sp.]
MRLRAEGQDDAGIGQNLGRAGRKIEPGKGGRGENREGGKKLPDQKKTSNAGRAKSKAA